MKSGVMDFVSKVGNALSPDIPEEAKPISKRGNGGKATSKVQLKVKSKGLQISFLVQKTRYENGKTAKIEGDAPRLRARKKP
jgi:hypothetical protein